MLSRFHARRSIIANSPEPEALSPRAISPCRVALIPFICAGDPDLETTEKALLELDRLGADIIEVGCPYSDPLADGPVIQAAATRALAKVRPRTRSSHARARTVDPHLQPQGTNIDKVLDVVRRASPKMKAPIVLFTYYNPIMARGLDEFCRDIKAAGASGEKRRRGLDAACAGSR